MAKSKFIKEFPFPVRKLADSYKRLEKLPFRLELGGKALEIVVADASDMYLIYDLQQQVIFGVEDMDQPGMISRILAVIIELWPTSILEIKNLNPYKKGIFYGILDWAIEYGGLTKDQGQKAAELRDLLK